MKSNIQSAASTSYGSKQDSIIEHFKQMIVAGELPPGARLPTHLELVEQFSVSSVTIQRSLDRLRNEGFIVPRGRLGSFVTKTPPHLHRYALVFASKLSGEPSVGDFKSPHAAPVSRLMDAIASAAVRYADDSGREIVFYTDADRDLNTENYQRLVADVNARRLAGVIFMLPSLSYDPALFRGAGIPCVTNAESRGWPGVPAFFFDTQAFLHRSLDYLAERGCKRVAWISVADHAVDPISQETFRRGVVERGMETGPHLTMGLDPTHGSMARNAALMLMNQTASKRPDGLIVSDDHFVSAAFQGVLESGVAVPDELKMVGLHNFIGASHKPEPSQVAHLGADMFDILRTAIHLLDAQRNGDDVPEITPILPTFSMGEKVNSTSSGVIPTPRRSKQVELAT